MAAIQVLRESQKPLTGKEITERAIEQNLISTSGKTPKATMNSLIAMDIKDKKERSAFVRVKPGIFALNPIVRMPESIPKEKRKMALDEKVETKTNSSQDTEVVGEVQIKTKPDRSDYDELMRNIKKGIIKLPQFQRDFIWGMQESADFIDSMLKGYPVGTFIFWRTEEELSEVRSIGGISLESHNEGFVQYVLDGQQRLTSLFAITEGAVVKKDGKDVDYKNIFIDLEKSPDTDSIVSTEKPLGEFITVYDLLHKDLYGVVKKYAKNELEKIAVFKKRLEQYAFSIILIEGSMEKAVEVFNRINTTGKALSLFDIMVAKTYEMGSFYLRDSYATLKESLSDESYEIPETQILQCLALNIKDECKYKTILELTKDNIITEWKDTVHAINRAIDHFKMAYRIPMSGLLPYSALIVPFCYFFRKNKNEPTALQDAYLKEYFWRAALTSRFTSGVPTKLASDCRLIKKIINGMNPEYGKEFNVTLDEKDIQTLKFRVGESVSNAVLCVLASMRPQSFKNGVEVSLDNANLSKSNSRNYHHFFPKAFLKKQRVDNNRINLTANITFIGADLNMREIKARAPSEYMKEFSKINQHLEETMKTHLIGNFLECGIQDDDYAKFIEMRSARIWKELESRLNPKI